MSRFSRVGPRWLAVLLASTGSCWATESIDADWLRSKQPAALEFADPNASIESSVEALQLAQQQASGSGVTLVAPLRDLAYALARAGQHREAIPHLERALSIVRVNYGVFDLRQIELLKQLAASLSAVGRDAEAQEHMLYAVRAAEKNYGSPDVRVVPAYCDLGNWFADSGKFRESRMAYQVALNIVEASAANDNLAAVEPLRDFAASFMRELSHPATVRREHMPPAFGGINTILKTEVESPRELAAAAEHSLREALRILDGNPRASTDQLIDTLVQTGDWFQIRKAPAKALPYYQRAWRLIESNAEQVSPGSRLDIPVRVYYPTPLIARNPPAPEVELRYVELEFDVEADGSVSKARVVEHDTLDKYAADVLAAMQEARFRPKFIHGNPVTTRAVSYRQVLRLSRPVR
ncbi:MAG TPA: tetratricopeptide repeat protein [Steroidobacter sp.]|uniref:tetratricopeptide repeat protein n=1 Tax=Steroidobacter sp. TaxID=1978227 RepID=UPI002ED8D9DC